ncbi:Tn3 family transposase [Kribbella qitaiheensis]|uniref:Tn3 family transposase n=1 Tax=Kribbella qitaiheensis TaxID=1544730 RepID=A0A7G6WU11_9ACTN|nr:Tn3 family transposase [Kribbella qitaiheensis]
MSAVPVWCSSPQVLADRERWSTPPSPTRPCSRIATEPESLVAIKGEIERRWGTIDRLDILKYAEFDTGFIEEFTSVATRETLSKDVLWRRLLLVLFGLGTNMGSNGSR